MIQLDSVEIINFRGLRKLQLPQLGDVNLIVGKNNVGKSSILEALWLYANRGAPSVIWELLEARGEGNRPDRQFSKMRNEGDRVSPLKHLFYGWDIRAYQGYTIEIGSSKHPEDQMSIEIVWRPISSSNSQSSSSFEQTAPFLMVAIGDRGYSSYRLDQEYTGYPTNQPEPEKIHSVIVKSNGLSPEYIAKLWDNVVLTSSEENVVEALRIIAPKVERVNLIAGNERSGERMPIVKIKDQDTPIPLRSMGDGMLRLFGIALALVNAKKGFLLIDEVENGLHYSVQENVWKLIFELAHKLNVQVFATSHSWDCIEAFQKAANEDQESEGLLIRLEALQGDNIKATEFDERKLAIAAREQIEIR